MNSLRLLNWARKKMFFFAKPQQNKCNLCRNDFMQRDYCCKPCLWKIAVCVCVCETPLCSVTTNPRSHTSPFLWLTWGRFWSSSWTVATRYPAPPCAVTDSHLGIRPAGWRRWLLPLAHPEWRCFLSSSGCWLTDLNPFSHLSSEEHGRRHRSVHTSRLTPVHTHYQGTHTWHAFINVVVSWEISQYCTHIENNVTVPREKVTKGFGWNRHHLHFLKKKTTKTC